MILLEQVAKRFGDLIALHPLDLAVEPGTTLAVIGPSGCGKSTLLGLINGLVRPDSGRVVFDGETLTPGNVEAVRRRTGYVIQEGGLFPHMTAGQNVTLMARTLDWSAPKIEERLEELTALTHFPADALVRFPGELSGGQRQRVSLMRALMLDPDVLLLDEPLGALDPVIRYDLQTELKDIFRRLTKTVVLVTHDIAEAAFFGNTLLLMRAGRAVQEGPFAELARNPADPFVSRFISARRSLDGAEEGP